MPQDYLEVSWEMFPALVDELRRTPILPRSLDVPSADSMDPEEPSTYSTFDQEGGRLARKVRVEWLMLEV